LRRKAKEEADSHKETILNLEEQLRLGNAERRRLEGRILSSFKGLPNLNPNPNPNPNPN